MYKCTTCVIYHLSRGLKNASLPDLRCLPALEAKVVAENGTFLPKPKTVWVSLTPKQLSVKEYFMIIIPRRVHSFRLIPATSVTLVRYGGPNR